MMKQQAQQQQRSPSFTTGTRPTTGTPHRSQIPRDQTLVSATFWTYCILVLAGSVYGIHAHGGVKNKSECTREHHVMHHALTLSHHGLRVLGPVVVLLVPVLLGLAQRRVSRSFFISAAASVGMSMVAGGMLPQLLGFDLSGHVVQYIQRAGLIRLLALELTTHTLNGNGNGNGTRGVLPGAGSRLPEVVLLVSVYVNAALDAVNVVRTVGVCHSLMEGMGGLVVGVPIQVVVALLYHVVRRVPGSDSRARVKEQ